ATLCKRSFQGHFQILKCSGCHSQILSRSETRLPLILAPHLRSTLVAVPLELMIQKHEADKQGRHHEGLKDSLTDFASLARARLRYGVTCLGVALARSSLIGLPIIQYHCRWVICHVH